MEWRNIGMMDEWEETGPFRGRRKPVKIFQWLETFLSTIEKTDEKVPMTGNANN